MAIGTPTRIGSVSSNDNTQQTLAVSLSPSISSGDHVFVFIASDDALTGVGVTDAGGNTYSQVGASIGTPGTHGVQSNMFHAHATTGGASVTVDKGAAGNRPINVQVVTVTGIATSSALDQTTNAVFASGTSHAVGPTSSTTQADEIVFVLNGLGDNVTVTPNAGYTSAGSAGGDLSGTNGIVKQAVSYKIISSTGAQSATETLSGSAGAAMIIATFKAAGGTSATVTAVVADSAGSAPVAGVTTTAGSDALGYANGLLGAPWVAWTKVAGAASLTVTSGAVTPTTGTLGDASYPVSIGPDSLMEAVLTGTMLTSMSYGVAVRLTAHSSSADGYMAELLDIGSGSVLRLYKGAAFTSLADSTAYTKTDIDAFRITAVGTAIKGYLRLSGVWTEVVSATDSDYSSAGYPGFWVQDSGPVGGSITQVAWGVPSGTDATVTAVPARSAGAAPVAALGSGATVTAVVADSVGSAPPANQILSIVVNAPAVVSLGSAPVASISTGGTGATVTAVPALSAGSAPVAVLGSGSTVTAVVADSVGSAPVAGLGSGATVTAVTALSTGQTPRPGFSPLPAGGVGTAQLAATFAEDSA